MAVKYSGLLRFTDGIKAEIDLTADGAVEKAVIIDGDGDETPIGGGGSSDFTTAEVTITNNTSNQLIFAVPYIALYDEDEVLYSLAYFPANKTIALNIVLYKGSVRMVLNSGNPPSATCTGDIRGKGTAFNISGNGTITFGTASEG